MADKLEKTLQGEVQHRVREQFVRWLDAAVAQVRAWMVDGMDVWINFYVFFFRRLGVSSRGPTIHVTHGSPIPSPPPPPNPPKQEKTGKKALVDAFLDQTAAQVTKNFASDAKLKKAAVDQVYNYIYIYISIYMYV